MTFGSPSVADMPMDDPTARNGQYLEATQNRAADQISVSSDHCRTPFSCTLTTVRHFPSTLRS